MIERFGKTSDPFIASLVAHAANLGPDSGVDPGRVVKLAEGAARTNRGTSGWSMPWGRLAPRRPSSTKPSPGSIRRAASTRAGPPRRSSPQCGSYASESACRQAGHAPNSGATTINNKHHI